MITEIDINIFKKRFTQLVSDSKWEQMDKMKIVDEYFPAEDAIMILNFLHYIKGSLDTIEHILTSV